MTSESGPSFLPSGDRKSHLDDLLRTRPLFASSYESPYWFRTNLPYKDYLKVYHIEDAIQTNLGTSNRTLTDTLNDGFLALHQDHLECVEFAKANLGISVNALDSSLRIEAILESGFEDLISSIDDLHLSIEKGFALNNQLLSQLNISSRELIEIQKNPTANFANEQYVIARDLYEKGFDEDALRHVNIAIDGDSNNIGFPLEYRSYMLRAIIQLGRSSPEGVAVLHLEFSERDSLRAAKIVSSSDACESAKCFSMAAHAAQCGGELTSALDHISKAVKRDGENQDIQYSALRIRSICGMDLDETSASKLFRANPAYAVKASTDTAFVGNHKRLGELIQQETRRRLALELDLLRQLAVPLNTKLGADDDSKLLGERENLQRLTETLEKTISDQTPTLLFAIKLEEEHRKATNIISSSIKRIIYQLSKNAAQIKSEILNRRENLKIQEEKKTECRDLSTNLVLCTLFGGIVGVIFGFFGCTSRVSEVVDSNRGNFMEQLSPIVVWIKWIVTCSFGGFVFAYLLSFFQWVNAATAVKQAAEELEKIDDRDIQERIAILGEIQRNFDQKSFSRASSGRSGAAKLEIHQNNSTSVEIGNDYTGKIISITQFGAFMEMSLDKSGLIHISELAEGKTENVEDVVKVGDLVTAKCLGIDENGRVKLSRRAWLREQA